MSRAIRVCMFVEYLYPVVSGGRVPFAGGIEVQLAHLGRGLARRGFDVHVVTCDFGQPDPLTVDGLTLHSAYPPAAGLPVLRFFHPRLSRGLGALARVNPDVYLFQGASLWAGIVRDLAMIRGRPFVWLVGHDHDVLKTLPEMRGWRDRVWVRRAIRGADAIVSQTERQRATLLAEFGRASTVIPNPVEIPPTERMAAAGGTGPIVWVATYKPSKRPEWFTRFAERHPQVRCRMAGVVPPPPLSTECWEAARAVAARCANLEVLPTIPHERIGEFLRESVLFTHSSPAEGLPNAFLEAWAHGLPTVTSFDPDGVIETLGLGACRTTYEEWEAEIERRVADPGRRAEEGRRARAHAEAAHAPDAIHDRLAAVLERVLGR